MGGGVNIWNCEDKNTELKCRKCQVVARVTKIRSCLNLVSVGHAFFFLFLQEVDDRGSLQFPAPCCSKQTLTDLVIVLPTFQSNS